MPGTLCGRRGTYVHAHLHLDLLHVNPCLPTGQHAGKPIHDSATLEGHLKHAEVEHGCNGYALEAKIPRVEDLRLRNDAHQRQNIKVPLSSREISVHYQGQVLTTFSIREHPGSKQQGIRIVP